MALNLVQNFSFETGIAPWQTGGSVASIASLIAFEGSNVARMGPLSLLVPGNAVLSQAFAVPVNAVNLQLSYAIQLVPGLTGLLNGEVQTHIRWQRGVADGYSTISEATLETIENGALLPDEWETHVIVSGPVPAGTVQARLRFILLNGELGSAPVYIDEVVITGED